MQQKGKIISIIGAAVCLMVVTSCSLTNLNTVWKDPEYQGGKLKNVLVVGGFTNQTIRRIFEDEFTAKLKSRGTNAIQSYRIFPSEKKLDRDTIEPKTNDLGIDAILITRVVNRKTVKERTPSSYNFYYRNTYFYDWPNRYPRYGPARFHEERLYYSVYEVLDLETNIYDTLKGKLIWSALADTVVGGPSELEISSFVTAVMRSLSENQLID